MPGCRCEYHLTDDLLAMTAILVARASETMRGVYGLTLGHYRALGYIRQGMADTVTGLSSMLDVAKCKVSGYVSRLCELGYVEKARGEGLTVPLRVTARGEGAFEEMRESLQLAFDEVLSPLDESQRMLFDMSCTATTILYDGFRLTERTPDFVYIYLRACLLTERSLIKTTKRHGLSLTDFRVLFSLLSARGLLMPKELAARTTIPKATLSECLSKLGKRGLVEFVRVDGRSKLVWLTMRGMVRTHYAALDVAQAYMTGVRSTDPFERELSLTFAEIIVGRQRDLFG